LNSSQVSLFLPTNYFGTGTAGTFTIGSLPSVIQPADWYGVSALIVPVPYAFDNGVYVPGATATITGSTLTFNKNGSPTTWTASGSRAAGGLLSYAVF
jgi:hypothetical protein